MIRKYKLGYNRLSRGYREGFSFSADKNLITTPTDTGVHRIFLRALDKGGEDVGKNFCWGRLNFNAELGKDTVYSLTALASDDKTLVHKGEIISIDEILCSYDISSAEKKRLLEQQGGSVFTNVSDMLLYEQEGRYLWLCLEVWGNEAEFSDFSVYVPGDNFFQTFPEVYRKSGEFFHRYISVFSSLYNDLQEKIEDIDKLIDIDTAPAGILPVFADWLGLDGDFLSEPQLRALLKIAFDLIKTKGTRHAVEQIVGIFVDKPFYVIENREAINGTPFCFTVLINLPADEKLHACLLFLLNQFKPLRTKARIIFAGDICAIDSNCYLDVNASIVKISTGRLDERSVLNGRFLLT
jgi:phage tail-like protein